MIFADKDDKEVVTTSGLVVEKTAGKKASVAVYHGVDGAPLSKSVVADITQFQVSQTPSNTSRQIVLPPSIQSSSNKFLCTLVNTSYFGGFNSLLSGRRRNEGGNKKHYDISKLKAAGKKVQGSIHKPRYWG